MTAVRPGRPGRPGRAGFAGLAAALAALAAAGCTDDGPDAPVTAARRSVLPVEFQSCADPNPRHGVGVVVGDGLVVTAGHVVEGEPRRVIVGGQPADVVAIDRNADLATLSVDGLDAPPLSLSALEPDALVLVGTTSSVAVEVTGHELLVIEHASDRATYRRRVLAFVPGVAEGASGTPLVDRAGRLAGIVILADAQTDEGIAVVAGEIADLLRDPAPPEQAVTPLHYC